MRGFFYHSRRMRFLALVLVLVVLWNFSVNEPKWIKRIAEEKLTEFMGYRLNVQIGSVSGGIFRDMILQDVEFYNGENKQQGKVFRLERVEISYKLWQTLLEQMGLVPKEKNQLKYVGIYLSKNNPFLRGFVKLYSYPGKIELVGHVSPILFGDRQKRGIKGVFNRTPDGTYSCDIFWEGTLNILGEFDPEGRTIDLGFTPIKSKKGLIKIRGLIDENDELKIYSRIDKVNVLGNEIIGDINISYRDVDVPEFMFSAENLVVNKIPVWDFSAGGKFSKRDKTLFLDSFRWGEGLALFGKIEVTHPYTLDLRLLMNSLRLHDLTKMLNNTDTKVFGKAEGEISFKGPALAAEVKGRIYIGDGVLENMEFKSLFATLNGKLPVIKVVDARAIKEGGHILIDGEIDFRNGDKAFDTVLFDTDNKVAVWEDWQIYKEERFDHVEATRGNMTITTSMEDEDQQTRKPGYNDPMDKELGVSYKLDGSNSLKMEVDEDRDFFGLEHKVQF